MAVYLYVPHLLCIELSSASTLLIYLKIQRRVTSSVLDTAG